MLIETKTCRRIALLSCRHSVDDSRVTYRIAKTLAGHGFNVTWIGPGRDDGRARIKAVRFIYYKAARGKVTRVLNVGRLWCSSLRIGPTDVYFAVEPDSAWVAARLARKKKAKSVFDIHEIYHKDALTNWIGSIGSRIAGLIVKKIIQRIIRMMDLVVAVSDEVLKPYTNNNSMKIVINNCAERSFGECIRRTGLVDFPRKLTIMHGKSTVIRGTIPIIKAAALVQKRLGIPVRVIIFRELTKDSLTDEKLRKVLSDDQQQCIDLRDPVPYLEMSQILADCDLGVLMYPRSFGVSGLPNRLFEYMSIGLPMIGPDYGREVRKIVEQERCGILVDCERPDAVAAAIIRLAEHPEEMKEMGERGRRAFLERYNWETEVRPLLDWLTNS